METEFEVRMTTGSMYRFLMYHAYHSFSGGFSILAGAALLVFYFLRLGKGTPNVWIYLLFGLLFLLYEPWTLYTASVRQVKLNPVYKHPVHYRVSAEGIAVQQGENTGQVGWESVQRVRETSQSILVYTGKKNACIWIKAQLGESAAPVRELLKKYVPADRLKLRGTSD